MPIKIRKDQPPIANNDLDSELIFAHRNYYKEYFPNSPLENEKTLDIWYEKPLYGKVDFNNNIVFPNESKLKAFTKASGAIFAFDFVVEAFEEMFEDISYLRLQNKIDARGSFLSDPKVEGGWESVSTNYHASSTRLFQIFYDYLKNKNKLNFANLTEFMPLLSSFLEEYASSYPITKSGYIISRFNGLNTSGLSLDVFDGDPSNDRLKTRFINDKYFSLYRKLARNYGFYIDKNIPWRLVADVRNPSTIKRLKDKGILVKDFFKKYFYNAREVDFQALKIYSRQFYNSMVNWNSYIIDTCSGQNGQSTAREVVEEKDFEEQVPDEVLLYTLLKIKSREVGPPSSDRELELFKAQMIDIERAMGYNQSLIFMENFFKAKLLKKLEEYIDRF